jgi:hypothetical protein
MKRNNKSVSVIVPFGYSPFQREREGIVQTVVKECLATQTYSNKKIVFVEASEDKTQINFAKKYCDEYIFIKTPQGSFGSGAVQNQGFLLSAKSPYIYIHQADFLLPINAIENSLKIMSKSSAPFIFPFFSSINLSKPLTEAVVDGVVDWKKLYKALWEINKMVKKETLSKGLKKRIKLDENQLKIVKRILPDGLMTKFLKLKPNQVWGEDDGSFTYFSGFYNVDDESDVLLNYRPGARAKASYLAKSDAYAKTGGPPSFTGWAPDDLGFWAKVQTLFDYSIKNEQIYYKNYVLTSDMPLVHMWHSTSKRPGYYNLLKENTKIVKDFIKKSKAERLKEIKLL